MQQSGPTCCQLPLGLLVGALGPARTVENVLSFPIAFRRDVVEAFEQAGTLAEQSVDFGFQPDVKFPLLMLAVGIEAACEAAFPGHHLAADPSERLIDPLSIQRALRLLPNHGQQIDELGVVIEHLLEMRDEPARIGRVAGEPAAEMIVNAALGHRVERLHDRIAIGRLAGALPGPP